MKEGVWRGDSDVTVTAAKQREGLLQRCFLEKFEQNNSTVGSQ
jgi:hypothetical protein